MQAYQAYLQDLLFATYLAHFQLVPDWSLVQLDQNPNWSSDLPIIPDDVLYPSFPKDTLLPYLGETSSSQMPFSNDIDELGPVVFGNRRRL